MGCYSGTTLFIVAILFILCCAFCLFDSAEDIRYKVCRHFKASDTSSANSRSGTENPVCMRQGAGVELTKRGKKVYLREKEITDIDRLTKKHRDASSSDASSLGIDERSDINRLLHKQDNLFGNKISGRHLHDGSHKDESSEIEKLAHIYRKSISAETSSVAIEDRDEINRLVRAQRKGRGRFEGNPLTIDRAEQSYRETARGSPLARGVRENNTDRSIEDLTRIEEIMSKRKGLRRAGSSAMPIQLEFDDIDENEIEELEYKEETRRAPDTTRFANALAVPLAESSEVGDIDGGFSSSDDSAGWSGTHNLRGKTQKHDFNDSYEEQM
jgi:hypothetical protein